jgi:cytochrome c-type biogenesis protein CcmH/NrfF
MRERYGDFVLYRPPLNKSTAILWAGPFILLAMVGGLILIRIRRREQIPVNNTDSEELQSTQSQANNTEADRLEKERSEVRKLLENTPELMTDKKSDRDA